ncbi:MAG TPA: PmoA family protein [Acidimicrobiales bacterium]|nr:PmoA family protein [Acidimicrobiales bacterium]
MTAKPHVHPVHSPGGRLLTRVSPADHPWQRALWFAVKYVNGENFWEEPEGQPFGRQVEVGGGRIEWRSHRGDLVLEEQRVVDRRELDRPDGDAYALDWTTSLRPVVDVELERTPYTTWGGYGGLTLRGAGDWEDTRMLLADGSEHRRPEGVPSPWCDLSGPDAGMLFLDHPSNARHPVPWYGATRSRVYGTDGWSNYLNAAFLFHEGMRLAAGEVLTLRYRIVVHDGPPWSVDECASAWEAWVGDG